MPDLSRRVYTPEIMDGPNPDPAALRKAYRELTRINRWLGGVRGVRRFLGAGGGTLLDVAAGGCDLAGRLGEGWRIVALDRNRQGFERLAGVAGVDPVQGDAFRLPFRDSSIDVVVASLYLHHLNETLGLRLLGEMHRVARRRVIVNDLHRARVAWASVLVLTRLLSRSDMVRNDAPLSVRRAFRPGELEDLARRAGFEGRVYRSFPYRLVLVIGKGPAAVAEADP